jgi:dolichol-phosphate mannosyltransferase
MRLSIITPAFNEAENLGPLYARLAATMAGLRAPANPSPAHSIGDPRRSDSMAIDWEWVVVDDHSRDATFDVLRSLAVRDPRVRGLRLSRNAGSHTAIACGLHHVTGDAAIVLAGDLQDPPEIVQLLLEEWYAGAQVVWGARREREDASGAALRFAWIYYFIMRRLVGMKEMPAKGADVFLADRVVIDAFRKFPEHHVSILALITWMGFRQAFVSYDKQRRHRGVSGWSFAKKLKLVVDSVTGFSDFPIRFAAYVGVLLMVLGAAGGVALAAAFPLASVAVPLVAALVIGLSGLQLLALGIVGAYVWRTLDEARGRPQYLVEALVGVAEPAVLAHE